MKPPCIRAASYVLAHTPDLVRYGSKPSRELARSPAFADEWQAALRDEAAARAYLPNRVFLGELDPDVLRDTPRPWWSRSGAPDGHTPFGVFLNQAAAYGAIADADRFDLVTLEEEFAGCAAAALAADGLWFAGEPSLGKTGTRADILHLVDRGDALPLVVQDALVGCVRRADAADESLSASVLLENLAAKATAAAAVRRLLRTSGVAPDEIEYVIGTGEEAVGDRYQRGGGNLGKAIAEQAGLQACTGVDMKGFCCGPVHALVTAGALVQAGVFRHVLVVGGASLAKLGMKAPAHIKAGMPIVEDVLAAFAILVGPHDGVNPSLRLDAVGRHDIRHGSSAQQVAEALTVAPLERLGRRLIDVDKLAVELHNPEVTEPAGSGDVPRSNYRLIGSLAARRGLIARDAIGDFETRHGMIGFSPTQGHVASAIPYVGHAWRRMREGSMNSTLLIAKGSLFLGRMTQMADGISVLMERTA
jgi:betaine reductase